MAYEVLMLGRMTAIAKNLPYAVIGGGFYGCAIAVFLAQCGKDVILIEAEDELLLRASYNNQARLHGGYHYPRSFNTAYRSRVNLARFVTEYGPAITSGFTMLYAIARGRSHVSARQFVQFCQNIEAPLVPARPMYTKYFSSRLVEAVFEVQEYAFDAAVLRSLLRDRLTRSGVRVFTGQRVTSLLSEPSRLVLNCEQGLSIAAQRVFNCTYSGLNRINGIGPSGFQLKHEIAEMVLVEPPLELKDVGVTVMDGSFFSFMPFPDRELHSFSHVRYTPHAEIKDDVFQQTDPYQALNDYPAETHFAAMQRDAGRFIAAVDGFKYRGSLFEVKTVLIRNEDDDGRPILFSASVDPRVVSILGSKIDNIYDALEAIETQVLENSE